MNKEIQSIIRNMENTLDGEPWYGRPVYAILREVDSSIAYKKPSSGSHSLIDLLYHMLTWAEFTLKRVEKDKIKDLDAFEKLDWREIDPKIHDWDEALAAFIATHQQIIAILQTKDDAFLNEPVDYRQYNFRYLLNGLIQHNIYHLGQIVYLKKLLV
ncbi:MAG TPA: DinB family protein [Chitinophagaceae bacterium]|nr:DinB family protein [Chitinophagaceae bacterium]